MSGKSLYPFLEATSPATSTDEEDLEGTFRQGGVENTVTLLHSGESGDTTC